MRSVRRAVQAAELQIEAERIGLCDPEGGGRSDGAGEARRESTGCATDLHVPDPLSLEAEAVPVRRNLLRHLIVLFREEERRDGVQLTVVDRQRDVGMPGKEGRCACESESTRVRSSRDEKVCPEHETYSIRGRWLQRKPGTRSVESKRLTKCDKVPTRFDDEAEPTTSRSDQRAWRGTKRLTFFQREVDRSAQTIRCLEAQRSVSPSHPRASSRAIHTVDVQVDFVSISDVRLVLEDVNERPPAEGEK